MVSRPRGITDLTRRTWVQWVGVGTAALGCGDNRAPPDVSAAVLEPTASALFVALWSHDAEEVEVELSTDGLIVASEAVPLGDGGIGLVDAIGLDADRAYEIVLVSDGVRLAPQRARTAPRDDATAPVRIAVSADFDPHPMFESALIDHVIAAEPQLFVSLGDFPYSDNGPIAQTVHEYRARHAQLRMAPAARKLLSNVSVRAIYDDHEFRNDWDTQRAATEADRYAAAMQVWDEFFPVRGATGEIRYRSWRWGAHTECFLLDCRRFRSPNDAPDNTAKTMLGDTQRTWLIDQLRRSTATFKLVFTSVPLDFGIGNDHWATFTTEREALFDAIVGIPGILIVSADQHHFASYRHSHGIREFQVGPLARGVLPVGPVTAGVLFRSQQFNAGLIDIDGDRLVMTGIGPTGERFFEETLTADALTPR
jgi:phosphodiesterase/alkaline phosphatase D-like protein